MDSERWERIKKLFEAALERPEHERSQFLAGACQNDEERHAVESLLSGDKNAGDFLKEPVAHISPAAFTNDHQPATFAPSEIISGRFQVLRFIGRGGMGEVYEARDLKLRERVALKTIRPEIASDPRALERFKKEITTARRVRHRNVCRMYDLEEHQALQPNGGPPISFLTMELLEGETLADRLRRTGRMSCEEALPLIRQMAEGLAAAHKEGVVHCDFKPGNVMLVSERLVDVDSMQSTQSLDLPAGQARLALAGSAGSAAAAANANVPAVDVAESRVSAAVRAVITDFGLARAMRPMLTRESIQESLDTDTEGHLVGTLPYMAPEQLEGHTATPTTDVYALGLVMYEMVTGRQPFTGPTPLAAAYKRCSEAPPAPRTLAPGLDAGLEKVILRCLRREPEPRYADASEVATALAQSSGGTLAAEWLVRRRIPIVAVLALLALLFGVLRYFTVRGTKAPVKPENLVVLPFTAVRGHPEEVAYCDGFTIVVTAELAKIPSLTVAPDFEVHDKQVKTVDDARAVLGASRVLRATWQRLGDEIVVTLELVDTRTNRQLQARNVNQQANDLYALQIEVVQAAVGMLNLEPPTLPVDHSAPTAAYDDYVRGRGYLQDYLRAENIDYALAAFTDAIGKDPGYAPAHAGLGESYWQKFKLTSDPQWVEETRAECQRAVALNSSLANGHICLGTLENGTGKYEEAAREFHRALTLEPANGDALRGLAIAERKLNQPAEAEKTYLRAIEVRPEYWGSYNSLGLFYEQQSRLDDAAKMFSRVVELAPDSFFGYSNLGDVYVRQGRYLEAEGVLQRSISIRPTAYAYSNLTDAYFYMRRFADEARTLEQALRLDDSNYAIWGNLGVAYYWAPGERTKAAKAFERAIAMAQERLRVDPRDAGVLQDLAGYNAMLDKKSSSLDYLDRALSLTPRDPALLLDAASIYNQFRDANRALIWLQKALAAGISPSMVRDTPDFDSLRNDPRYQELMRGR
jgi:serine/threonine protein kinase/tetratricopeptide (TPR) repeat protein